MGIIIKQSIRGTILSYIGAVLGFVATGILMPNYFRTEQVGLIQMIIASSLIFIQMGGLGFVNVTTRLFTYFRDEEKRHNGFLFIALSVTLSGFLLMMIIFFFIKPWLIERYSESSALFVEYIFYLIPLIFFSMMFNVFDHYYKVLYNAVIGIFLKEVFLRISVLILIFFFIFNIIDFSDFVLLYVLSYSIPFVFIVISLIREKQLSLLPNLSFITKDLRRSMIAVGLFGIISSFTGIVTLSIDRLMINDMIGLGHTGVYAIAFFFGSVIILPSRSVLKISSTLIADAWKEQDMYLLRVIYKKSCLTLFIIGLLITAGLWVNIDNIFEILPKEYQAGRYVVLFIALAYLSDMLFGAAASIIANSTLYKYSTYFMLVQIVLIIITNYLLIPVYGITGAAFASMITKIIVNLLRYFFIVLKFRIQPFSLKFLYVLIVGLIAYIAGYFIPVMGNYFVDIMIRSGVIVTVFGTLILVSGVSEDINKIFADLRSRLKL